MFQGGVFLLTLFLVSCLNPFPKGTDVFYNRSYGPDIRNKVDVYLPQERGSETETVVLIHGGAWVAGDKGGAELKDVRNMLLEEGYAVASMNYRYACGDYHKQMEDVDNALAYLTSSAVEWNIGSERFGLVGMSAGGHLALLYGHAFNQDSVVKTVVSIVGPTDLTNPQFHSYANNYGIMWTLEELVGTTFAEDSAAFAEASPLFRSTNCPSLFIYGGIDDLVPKEQGIARYDTLQNNGVPSDTLIPANGSHNVYGPNNIYKTQVDEKILGWINTHLDG